MFEHLRNTKPYHATTLVVGDPARAEYIAHHFLKQAECITTHRGLVGFNGVYHGHQLSIQTTGMGSASTAIVMEELIQAGVSNFYRLGSCCLLRFAHESANDQDIPLVLPIQAHSTARVHENYHPWWQAWLHPYYQPDHLTTSKLHLAARKKRVHVVAEAIASVESYYNHRLNTSIRNLLYQGICAIDMETSTVFDCAAYYHKTAIALLNPYDVLEYNQVNHRSNHRVLPADAYRKRTKQMIELALNQIVSD